MSDFNAEDAREQRMARILERAQARRQLNDRVKAERQLAAGRQRRRQGLDNAVAGMGYRMAKRMIFRLIVFGGLTLLSIILGMEFLRPDGL